MKKIFVDSAIYTHEGISGHSREEAKEFFNRGYDVFLTDINYNIGFDSDEKLKNCYTPINRTGDDYIWYSVQPPYRQYNVPFSLAGHMQEKNLFYFLAFESKLPTLWLDVINKANIKSMITCSNYCKQQFLYDGVKHPIEIVPHGIDIKLYSPPNERQKNKKFTFLWVGTVHNKRKNLEGMIDAWKQFKHKNKSKLIVKISTIYGIDDKHRSLITDIMNDPSIEIITDVLSDKEMAELFINSDCYVSPHTSEGFGMNILQAMAVDTPVICSGWTGNIDFTTNQALHLERFKEKECDEEPYIGDVWKYPKSEELVKAMNTTINGKYPYNVKEVGKRIRKDYNYQRIVDKLEKVFHQQYK